MNTMERPKLEILRFENEDVIAASGGIRSLSWENLGDSTRGNGTMRLNGTPYTDFISARAALLAALRNDGVAVPDDAGHAIITFNPGAPNNYAALMKIMFDDDEQTFGGHPSSAYNGVYSLRSSSVIGTSVVSYVFHQ